MSTWRHQIDHVSATAALMGIGWSLARKARWGAITALLAASWSVWRCHAYHHGGEP